MIVAAAVSEGGGGGDGGSRFDYTRETKIERIQKTYT